MYTFGHNYYLKYLWYFSVQMLSFKGWIQNLLQPMAATMAINIYIIIWMNKLDSLLHLFLPDQER